MSPTILVIDDNPKIKESLVLAFPEYRFIGALSGEKGLKVLSRPHEIDLVMLDYKMRGMDGLDTLKEIRRMDPKIGVILLTSFGTKEVIVEALRRHADDFIDKPYDIDEMQGKLENFFERRAEEEKRSGGGESSIQRIRRFVERNYKKNPTLKQAAERASLSAKYVSRKFKEETRQTFSDYRISLKMEQAKKLLRETSLGVAQIAYKVGYENAESFMKMFRKFLDCTPTEYRRQGREEKEPSADGKDGG